MGIIVALDVGGTYIKGATLKMNGEINVELENVYPSNAKLAKEEILQHFVDIIRKQAIDEIDGIGLAFPGPFDYVQGISKIKGIDKYDSLYGVNLKQELLRRMAEDSTINLSSRFKMVFENDAALFALGEYHYGKTNQYQKGIYVVLGTGCGSAFLKNGELQKEIYPLNGWVYNEKFKDSIIDDYISKRGIENLAKKYQLEHFGVKELDKMAVAGNQDAQRVFEEFGFNMGEALRPFVLNFGAEAVIFGGQIAKGKDLFLPAFEERVKEVKIEISEATSRSTFLGNIINLR